MHPRFSRRAIGAVVAAVAVVGTTAATAPAAFASAGTVTIAHTKPSWLSRATRVPATMSPRSRAAEPTQTVRVYLAPTGGLAALQAAALAASTPSSASYGAFLTSAQYQARYAPTKAAVNAVSSYLSAQGLTVSGVGAGNRYITAAGSTAALDAAFGVTLSTWTHDGQTVTAPATDVVLPASVGAKVLTVTGLDTTVAAKTHDATTVPPAGFANGRPCSITYGQIAATFQADYKTRLPKFLGSTLPYANCGYTGPQLRSAYEANSALDGTGVTVAITDAYSWQLAAQDANTYAVNHGDGSYTKGQLTLVSPKSTNSEELCGPSGWAGEQMLDIEAVHAMAPAAKIRYYGAASCLDDDLLPTLMKVVDDNKAQIVSSSWGDTETNASSAGIVAYQEILAQGALQGISFLWSSGDNGDELANTGIKQADYPASDPMATAVGGTSTAIDATATIAFQTGWGTQKYTLAADGKSWTPVGYLYGAGGGYSTLFNRPTYQDGVVPSTAPAGRAEPDVAMDADPNTGFLIGITQTFSSGVHYGEYRIGGTSLASPLFAGITALKIQANKGKGLGLLNPRIYTSTAQFTDVVPVKGATGEVRVDYKNGEDATGGLVYSVRTFDQDSTLATAKGWDPVTGVGVPSVAWFGGKTAAAATGSATSGGTAKQPGDPVK